MGVSMKAVRIPRYGGPEVLVYEDAPRPTPGPGEVLLRVQAVAVNPIDWKVRAGHLQQLLQHRLPLIPGWDVSGVVETTGPGAEGWRAGDEVFALLDKARDGAYAEFAIAQASWLARKPASVDHVRAASVPVAGLAAWQSLFDAGGLASGQRVFITGAAGSVGGFAVQLAKHRGASVLAGVAAADAAAARALGADVVVDLADGRFEDAVSGVDLVLDVIGGEIQERAYAVLHRGGTLVSTVGIAAPEKAAALGVAAKAFVVEPSGAQLAQLAALLEAGVVTTNVGTVLPLARASEAHELVQSGRARGKVVLQVVA
jgi:NADPH:quinone reductase-like Zn-dependent oxidoreductase